MPARGRRPDQVAVEAAKELNLVDIRNQSHIEISGLNFRFENVWPWQDRWLSNIDVVPACVRMLGSCTDIRVANCTFDHVAEAVRTPPPLRPGTFSTTLRFATTISPSPITGASPLPASVGRHLTQPGPAYWRNRLLDIGFRPIVAQDSVAIEAGAARYLEIAGNIIDRAYGSGFMVWGGWERAKGRGKFLACACSSTTTR